MEKEVIKIKPEWERIVTRHTNKCNELKQVVERLIESGLTVNLVDVKNLINRGSALYEQAEQTVKSNAEMFKLPAAREKFIEENTKVFRNVIDEAKKEINRILAVDSSSPLTIDAYLVTEGQVSISEAWVAELKEIHTIRATDERTKALELIHNVEVAIKQLNEFVKNNPHFGCGITTSHDTRRSLMWLSGDGNLHIENDALEFV